jgi:cytochrome P450
MLRVAAAVPVVARQANTDTTLLGHFIPAGTSVFMMSTGPGFFSPAYSIDESKRSPTSQAATIPRGRWEEDGRMRSYIPERWLVNEKTSSQDRVASGDKSPLTEGSFDPLAGPTMPFGLGTRGCFGRRLAYMELRILLTLIVWNFEFLPCPPELSSYAGKDGLTHRPQQCYARIRRACI